MSKERKPVGLILAGGRNTRLLPLTEDTPKALLPITPDGATMLDRAIFQMREAGIREIKVLVSPQYSWKGMDTGDTEFIPDREEGVIPALYNAVEGITQQSEVVVLMVDLVCLHNPVKQLLSLEPPAVLWDRIKDSGNYGVIIGNNVTEMPFDEGKWLRGVLGCGYYPPNIFGVLDLLVRGAQRPLSISDLNNYYAQEYELNKERIDDVWVDAGTPENLERARAWLARDDL